MKCYLYDSFVCNRFLRFFVETLERLGIENMLRGIYDAIIVRWDS